MIPPKSTTPNAPPAAGVSQLPPCKHKAPPARLQGGDPFYALRLVILTWCGAGLLAWSCVVIAARVKGCM